MQWLGQLASILADKTCLCSSHCDPRARWIPLCLSNLSARSYKKLFTNVKYYVAENDHCLGKSVHELDWNLILE